MSFVITTVSPETVVQVSDTRLSSLADQSVISESVRKSLIVKGKEAQFVLGWCGLATADKGHSTGDWLFRVLYEMDAVNLSPDEIAGNLATMATERFPKLVALDKRFNFVLGGWDKSGPFVAGGSNYVALNSEEESVSQLKHHIPSFSETAAANSNFQAWVQRFRNPTKDHFLVEVMGDCDPAKLKTLFKGLKCLLKKKAAAAVISSACRQIALEAGRHSKTIGKDLIALEMERNGHVYCAYYSEEGKEVMLVPDMLSLHGSSTQFTIRPSLSGDPTKVRVQGKIIKRPL